MVVEDAMYAVGEKGNSQAHLVVNPATTGLKGYDAIVAQMIWK